MQEAVFMSLKLVLAGVLGGIVGYEREVHEHPAGLRTHVLVCMGAALITLVSMSFSGLSSDPGRIAAQIVSGIGFLGAGTIIRQGSIVRGLTTAASLWTVAGIGMAVGVGGVYYLMAVVATGIVFITLSVIRGFEPGVGEKWMHELYLEMPSSALQGLGAVVENLGRIGVTVESVKSVETPVQDKRGFKLQVVLSRRVKAEAVIELLASQGGVDRFEWT